MAILVRLLAFLVASALCPEVSLGVRIHKSRRNALTALTGSPTEEQQFFTSCETNNNVKACRLAFDNDTSTDWSQCATTKPDFDNITTAYWRGYLEMPVYVTSVYIQNADWQNVGESDALLDFTISGNGEVCHSHLGTQSFESRVFSCDILTDEIEIRSNLINGSVLALCDVKVFGATLQFPTLFGEPTNVTYTDCDMSSTARYCYLAFDKQTNWTEKFEASTCAQTLKQSGLIQWWKATFEIPALVQRADIYNRIDSPKDMNNFEVTIGKRRCGRLNNADGFTFLSFSCNVFGGDIEIRQLNKGKTLTLCEVELYGHIVQMINEQKRKEIGCYQDKPSDPDLGQQPRSVSLMTVDKCDRICRRLKKKYIGLQGGMECWCGDSYGKHGALGNVSECSMPCEGSKRQFCGGIDMNLVYELL